MQILSLFDGMSCGQIALNELSIYLEKYYASEIDKFAIAQTQLNFPNTIQLVEKPEIQGTVTLADIKKEVKFNFILE